MTSADFSSAGPQTKPQAPWRAFSRTFLLTAAGVGALFAAGYVVLDPFDTGHFLGSQVRGTVEKTPRFAHASRGRDPRFTAAIFGNSHVQLLSPARLKALTGLEFVSLTVPGSGVGEKLVLLDWFIRHRETPPGALVIGIDDFDCARGDTLLQTNPFPDWVYAPTALEHVAGAFRFKGVRSLVAAALALVRKPGRTRDDGYGDYEAGRTWTAPPLPQAQGASVEGTADQPGSFLGIARLSEAVQRLAPETKVIFVRPPVHISALPPKGSQAEAREQSCTDALAAVAAARPGTSLLDFRSPDPEFSATDLYWDSTHYRRQVAERVEARIAGKLGRSSP